MSDFLLSPFGLVAALLSLAWIGIFLFFKKREKHQVTLAHIWAKLAKVPVRKPPIQRFKTLLTVLIGAGIIWCLTLWMAGALFDTEGKPESRQPIDLIIVIDTSPSTVRLSAEGKTGIHRMLDEARSAIAELSPPDRAWILWRSRGVVVSSGPHRKSGSSKELLKLYSEVEVDFSSIGWSPFVDVIGALDRGPERGRRDSHLLLLSDHDEAFLGKDAAPWFAPLELEADQIHREALGADGFDYRFSGVELLADGRVRLSGFFPDTVEVRWGQGQAAPPSSFQREGHSLIVTREMSSTIKRIEIRSPCRRQQSARHSQFSRDQSSRQRWVSALRCCDIQPQKSPQHDCPAHPKD